MRTGPPPPQPAEVITDPRVQTIDIGPPGQQLRIILGLPTVPAPEGGYSALFALDGNATFPLLWRAREHLAPDAPVLLVGIGYPVTTKFDPARRWYDLTSAHMVPSPMPDKPIRGPPDGQRTGGRADFLHAIETLVLPAVRQRVALDRSQMTLFGHSLGGLFAAHALLAGHLFARYALADPSTWWNAGEVVREAEAWAAGVQAAGGSVMRELVVGVVVSGGWRDAPQPRELVDVLNGVKGVRVVYKQYDGENHGSLLRPAADAALLLHLCKEAELE